MSILWKKKFIPYAWFRHCLDIEVLAHIWPMAYVNEITDVYNKCEKQFMFLRQYISIGFNIQHFHKNGIIGLMARFIVVSQLSI